MSVSKFRPLQLATGAAAHPVLTQNSTSTTITKRVSLAKRGEPMNLTTIAESTAPMTLVKIALFSRGHIGFISRAGLGDPIEKKGTTPYVTHFIFRPLMSIDIAGLGKATNLEMVGTTQNMKGEKMLDKMSAQCAALSVESGDKKYIDGACVLTDSDGDKI